MHFNEIFNILKYRYIYCKQINYKQIENDNLNVLFFNSWFTLKDIYLGSLIKFKMFHNNINVMVYIN